MSNVNQGGVIVATPSLVILNVSAGPANGYVAEDGITFYVAEDGTTFYVQEV